MSLAIEAFVDNVRRFCEWTESDRHDLLTARQLLLALMQSIPYLTVDRTSLTGEGMSSRTHDEWKAVHQRFGDLPFQHYRQVFSPLDLNEDEVVTGDLHDDLADIYWDLCAGLNALDAGRGADAIDHWRSSYFMHWGYHAASAIQAIDQCYRDKEGGEPGATDNPGDAQRLREDH